MCGIFGEIRFDGTAPSPARVGDVAQALRNRGPDAQGLFQHNQLLFGHRRLKVIDLSDLSAQPMFDRELGIGVVYNGAIYNYAELRQQLQALGYRFVSQGDTEILIKAYHAWGKDFVRRLNGMFAFALWRRDEGDLLLGRDRLGIKPLYYSSRANQLRFASNLQALLAWGEVDTSVDPLALHYYLSFHAVVPAPHTMLNGVRKVPPATLMHVSADGKLREETYWQLSFQPDKTCSEADWLDRLHQALNEAVKRRLVADVPVGVLLSGGLDSSVIVGLLSALGQRGLNTFSIGFESAGDEKGDEFQYSDLVANHFGTTHHQIRIGADRLLATLEQCVAAMSEPMVSHDNIGFYLLSAEVAKHVKVVQSGQGADEVFGGYHWYPPLVDATDPVARYAEVFCDRSIAELRETLTDAFDVHDHARNFIAAQFAATGATHPVDKALRLDTTVMLVDDPVKRVDNMTMAWGLEARVPFLDHELLELAAAIPYPLKIQQNGKHILKEVARRVIPHAVIDRPKGYFPVPVLKYLAGPYLAFVKEVLAQDVARQRNIFRLARISHQLSSRGAQGCVRFGGT